MRVWVMFGLSVLRRILDNLVFRYFPLFFFFFSYLLGNGKKD